MKKKIDIAKKKNWQGIADDIRGAIASGHLKNGDVLQGEQALAEKYGAGLYSVRCALKALKDAGVLHSVPKQGVFVGAAAEKPEAQAVSSEAERPYGDVIRYVTRGTMPPQRALYEEIASGYSSCSVSSRMEITYHQGGPGTPHPKGDIYEYASQSRFCFSGTRFVDFSRYFSHVVHYRDVLYNSTSVPLFRSVPLLIYNCDLLRSLGFAPPSYTSFDEQMAFLDELTGRLALKSNYCMPGTTQNMIHKCGNMRRRLYQDIADFSMDIPAATSKYMEIFRTITRYWKKYHISYPGRTEQFASEFAAGKSPIFFGLSSHFINFNSRKLPFEVGAAIMYSHDNTIDNDLGLLSIDMDSPNLVEAARAVDFIQAPQFQERLATMGCMPMLDAMYARMPFHNLERMTLIPASPILFSTPEEYYINVNIINVELWNVVLFDKSIEEALASIFSFSRSYLQMKLDQAAIETQVQKSDVYK